MRIIFSIKITFSFEPASKIALLPKLEPPVPSNTIFLKFGKFLDTSVIFSFNFFHSDLKTKFIQKFFIFF